jgi:hypothetical protein
MILCPLIISTLKFIMYLTNLDLEAIRKSIVAFLPRLGLAVLVYIITLLLPR